MTDCIFLCMTCRKRTAKLETTKNDCMVYLELDDGVCDRYWYPCTKCPEYEPVVENVNSKKDEE